MSHLPESHVLPLQYSPARRWHELRAFVFDALADAMHHRAALHGARLGSMHLLLSGRHLGGFTTADVQRQLDVLSDELRQLGVPHAIHQVLPGDTEPEQHQLRITLQRP